MRTPTQPERELVALVGHMVMSLVSSPNDVLLTPICGDRSFVIEVKVAPEDTGKIIGRKGRIAESMREIVKAAASEKMGGSAHVVLDIIDGRERRAHRQAGSAA